MEKMTMKKNLKKLFALGCTAALTLTTAGCSSSTSSNASEADTTAETSQEASADKEIYNVAIVKQLDHASLDEIANAVEAELDKIAEDNNVTIHYELYSGQNDQTTLKQIGDQAVADGVDAIIPIATLAAQVATVSAQQTQTPVVYAAVSDPEAAELTGIDYVTGTSDALNTEKIMDMIFAANPDVKCGAFIFLIRGKLNQTDRGCKGILRRKRHLLHRADCKYQRRSNYRCLLPGC